MFRKGQKLVSLKSDWAFRGSGYPAHGPMKNEIVTCLGYEADEFIYLAGYDGSFRANRFRPLLGDSAKDSLIQSFTEVTETSDLPIRQPETA